VSPLRGWMQAHGRPAWWSWLVVVLVPLLASVGVLVITLRVNERTVETTVAREREARRAAELAFCGIIVLLDDTYKRTPPETPAGKGLAKAVRDARGTYNCPPS
jgi:hypothetical protein